MSVRGIEIHNGQIDFPEGMPQDMHLGTWDSPLTQGVINQIVLSAVINATALGGTVVASLSGVHVTADMTGDAFGSRLRATVDSNIALTGMLVGQKNEVELLGTTASISGRTVGYLLEMYSEAGVDFLSDVQGIHVNNYHLGTMNTTYEFIRLEENGTAVPDNIMGVYVLDATTFLHLVPNAPASGAWSNVDDKTGVSAGWIKVTIGGIVKYIQLYSA